MLRRWRVLAVARVAGSAAGALNVQLFGRCVCAPDACAADEEPSSVLTQIHCFSSTETLGLGNSMLGEGSAIMAWRGLSPYDLHETWP